MGPLGTISQVIALKGGIKAPLWSCWARCPGARAGRGQRCQASGWISLQSRLKSSWMLSPEEPWGQADSREVGDHGGVCTSELGTPKLSVPWTHHWLWEPGTRSIGAPEFWLLAGWLVPAETCLVSVVRASPQNTTFLPSWAFCDRNLSMGCSLASPSSEQLCLEKECWTLDVERNMQELSV